MSQYDLKKLKLLASGGEANIYEKKKNKVLRVIYKKESNNKNTEENVYKIKLRSSGFRLAYEVKDLEIVVYVVSVGKRENNKVYENLKDRI
mgnify:CR=1 FL=1